MHFAIVLAALYHMTRRRKSTTFCLVPSTRRSIANHLILTDIFRLHILRNIRYVFVVHTLFSCAEQLCSSMESSSAEWTYVMEVLLTNDYSHPFISRHSARSLCPRCRPHQPPSSHEPCVVLFYVEEVSELIKGILSPLRITV